MRAKLSVIKVVGSAECMTPKLLLLVSLYMLEIAYRILYLKIKDLK